MPLSHRPPPDGADSWRWAFAAFVPLAAVLSILLLAVPHSPRWLLARRTPAAARATLVLLRGSAATAADVDAELARIGDDLAVTGGVHVGAVLRKLRQPHIFQALVTGFLLGMFQQVSAARVCVHAAARRRATVLVA